MIKILSLIVLILTTNLKTTSIEEERFMENVNSCYNQYSTIIDEETTVGDIRVILGIKDDEYYLSAFFLNEASVNMRLQVFINDSLEGTYVVEGTVINTYGIEIKETDVIKIVLYHESQQYNYNVNVGETLQTIDFMEGLGNTKFPKNKLETDVIRILRLFIAGFVLLSCCFVFVIVSFYKKRKGKFNEQNKTVIDVVGEYYEEYGDPTIDSEKEIEKVDKQSLMDRYFEEYRSGEITEEELNEKLKKLWWQNNDKN